MTIKSIFTTSVAAVALTVGALAFTGDALAKGGGGHGGHSSHRMNFSSNNNINRSMNFKQSSGSHHHHHYRRHHGGGIDLDGDDGDDGDTSCSYNRYGQVVCETDDDDD